MKSKASRSKQLYIIRPEIEVEYTKPILGRLCLMCNYWRFIKFGKCHVLSYTMYYIAIPRIYRKVVKNETM